MFGEGLDSSGFYDGGSFVIVDNHGCGCALAKLPLRLGSMSFFFLLFLVRHVVGGMK